MIQTNTKKNANEVFNFQHRIPLQTSLPQKLRVNLIGSFFTAFFLLGLTACDPVTIAIGGSAIAGAQMARNQNGLGGAIDDSSLQTSINKYLLDHDQSIFERVELSVKHGTAVVIGYMKNQAQCEKTKQLVREAVKGYNSVYFELSVGNFSSGSQVASDSGITSRIKSSLLFDGNVQSLNYDVTTVKGIVYITGTAQTKFERDQVLSCARSTSGVSRVVSYIKINKSKKTKGK